VKNAVFWDITPCSCCKNLSFGGTYRLHHQGDKNCLPRNTLAVTSNRRMLRRNASVRRLLVTANVVPSSRIPATLIMEVIRSSETSVLKFSFVECFGG
jgi:hypothetical protein